MNILYFSINLERWFCFGDTDNYGKNVVLTLAELDPNSSEERYIHIRRRSAPFLKLAYIKILQRLKINKSIREE